MGHHSKNQDNHSANGASVLVIDQSCDNDQLLISLNKNGTQWLSPIGWTDQQKVTLLDCRPNGDTTEIDIPAEFAGDIKTGDVLVLRCSELDVEKEIIWESSAVETRKTEDIVAANTSLAGGLLSRFKGSKVEVAQEVKSEAELRAEEADRAAQNYKAKMEAATAAKEQAHRRALEAAREAEAALKMEADRIAEMERAAKAFEEAERLKQDEMRRVEDERRAEEVRLAEEARIIEEARKREIAAQKEIERKAALERYEAALDITRDEERRLKARLKDLKHKAKTHMANNAVQTEDFQSRQGLLVNTEEIATKHFTNFEKSASKLDVFNADLAMLQTETETLYADRQALSIRLSQADTDYQQAQSEVEVATARAEARKTELDIIRQEESDVSQKASSVSEKLSSQSQLVVEASEKTQKLQLKYETAQAELAQAKIEIEALEQALTAQAEEDQNLRMEIEATQQSIEDRQARMLSQQDAIEHLEAGGVIDDIADIDFEVRNFEPESLSFADEIPSIATTDSDNSGLKDRIVGRVRRSFTREKEASISIDVKDVVLDTETQNNSVLMAADEWPTLVRRHSTSLMVLGAVIGGITILGAGYTLNQASTPKLQVKSIAPAPTQVASVVEKVEIPKVSALKDIKDIPETSSENVISKADFSTDEIPKIEKGEIEPIEPEEINTQPVTKETLLADEVEEETFVTKLANVVDPVGFAFELPDMMPKVQSKKVQAEKKQIKKTDKTPSVDLEKAKDQDIKFEKQNIKSEGVTDRAVTTKREVLVNYPELTSGVQTRLQALGFYNSDINGLQTKATKEAIKTFKTLNAMPVDDKITGALLTELKRVEREQAAAERLAASTAETEAQITIQVAEAEPEVVYYDTVQPVPAVPVITDSLPATSTVFPSDDSLPSYVEPEAEPVLIASIPKIVEPAPTPVVQDVIVEAKILTNASARYPEIAVQKKHYVNVAILVDYDIDTSGRASNINISSTDYSGRYKKSFEREAIKAVKKLRYEPRAVNGTAVETKGQQKRIVFRAE